MEGVTVLYIPKEGLDQNPEVASKNKELVQRLESKQLDFSDSCPVLKRINLTDI